eukprot:11777236-Alexandrium_andersonii.AAC.1
MQGTATRAQGVRKGPVTLSASRPRVNANVAEEQRAEGRGGVPAGSSMSNPPPGACWPCPG